jgi:glycosyltransferase involved in cell wall biosynthesis
VLATNVGPLPELIGPAGLLVGPGEPDRLAAALATIWADDDVHHRLVAAARARAKAGRRSWADVARDTRLVYAEVGVTARGPAPS